MFDYYIIYAANELTEQIRQMSPDAADCIGQIRAKFGVRAAYLAAFALVIIQERRTRLSKLSYWEDLRSFTYYEEMRNNAEAVRLYEAAARYLRPESARR